jgi:hypothetical protein
LIHEAVDLVVRRVDPALEGRLFVRGFGCCEVLPEGEHLLGGGDEAVAADYVGVVHRGSVVADGLMVGAGVVTTVPLLMFASAAQRIPSSLIGIYDELFTTTKFIGFSMV